ncbi:hypothetical protein DV515_00002620 [Chloebia gouldiae]|uniref:Testicular haploid expressed gene protein-like n=1 Tax=Chloebia gouldiae TaxID=44316 RepID=A0A3L8SVN1_CHLGU|nr:hypothetical protein DV515_00002620 [Chloebia gouldiae]
MEFLEMSSYTPCMCVHPRSRIEILADPKPLFCQASSPTLVWGNQETLWTLSPGAMTARPSARILYLCKPKKDFTIYGRSCRPVIGGNPLLPKFGYPSERLLRLSEPKKYLPAFLEQRTIMPPSGYYSLPSQRGCTQTLCRPERSSQKAVASPRTIELSKPRQLPAKFMPPRDPEWPVTAAAKRAVATERIVALAQPTARPRMGLTALNPDAFKVKEAAMKAVCSPRLEQLARPVQR